MAKKEKILLVHGDEEIKQFLSNDGFDVFSTTLENIFSALEENNPDILIANIDGIEDKVLRLCEEIKSKRLFSLLPALVYSKNDDLKIKFNFFNSAGVDDFLVYPFELKELSIRARAIIKRFTQAKDSNPLTGLPGNISIAEEIKKRIADGGKFAVFYIDLDNFKAYNDRYGYEKGDEIIKFLAKTAADALDAYGGKSDFLGHIGGDDFILVTEPSKMNEVAARVIEKFEKGINGFYCEEDGLKGYITVQNRRGQIQLFPVMTISIGIAHNSKRTLSNPVQVSEIATELKEYAKTKKGSNIAVDRRSE